MEIRGGDEVEIRGVADSGWVKTVAGKFALVMYEQWSDDFVCWDMTSRAFPLDQLRFKRRGYFTATWWKPHVPDDPAGR